MSQTRWQGTLPCLFVAVLLSSLIGCAPRPAPTVAPPSRTPVPTPTSSPAPTATSTSTPTPTATPTITPWPTRTPTPTWTPTPSPLAGAGERILFHSNRDDYSHIYAMGFDGRFQVALTEEHVDDNSPEWSSQAERLLFNSDREGDLEIYSLGASDYFARNLTNDPADDSYPDWSPDGKRIAFDSDRADDNLEIYVMDAEGGNQTRLTDDPADDWQPDWSPDGTQIAFVSDRDGNEDIWVMAADGSDPVNLTRLEADCEDPAWSPDGSTLAFSQQISDTWDIYLIDVAAALAGTEGTITRLTDDPDDDYFPTWSPDGTRIAFETTRTGNSEVFGLEVASPAATLVNLSRHSADDGMPIWVDTPELSDLKIEPAAVLNLLGGDPPHLDPGVASDGTSHAYISEIFSGLVRLDDKLEVVPDIASSWDVSQDGTVYIFHLRPDVKFQDGRPVTAEDFKYSIDRACDPDLGSTIAGTYLGDIVGVDEALAGEADEVSGVKVVDDQTLEITIDAPKAYFLAKLTYPTSYVVDRQTVEKWGDDWERHPNGTGPFKLALWVEDEQIILVRNDHYYDQMPALKRVSFAMTGIGMQMYEEGDIDTIGVGTDDVEGVRDPVSRLNAELVEVPGLDTSYIAFNCAVAPFDDPKVRQAFAYALDRKKLIEITYQGTVAEATGVLPPGMPAYDPEFKGIAFDPDRARQLLSESSYGSADKLPEVTILLAGQGGGVPPDIQAFISQIQENLGVEVLVEQMDWPDFLSAIEGKHSHQLYSMGWGADYVDPENFLDLLFHSESEANHTRYASQELDRLLEQARIERDEAKRLELYREAERLVIEEAVWIPLFHDVTYALVKPYVKGLTYTPLGIAGLEYVRLEERP